MDAEVVRLQTARLRASLETAERQLAAAHEALDLIELAVGLVDGCGKRIDE